MKIRILKLLSAAIIIVAAGILYFFINKYTGIYIPCIFNLITGFYCPGCGVTRMCLALLNFDIKGAFTQNPAIIIALPVLIYLFSVLIYNHIKFGKFKLKKFQNIIAYVLIVYFVIFGVLRNIPYFNFLAPH